MKKKRTKLTRKHNDKNIPDKLITIADNFLDEFEDESSQDDSPPHDLVDNVIDFISRFKPNTKEDSPLPTPSPLPTKNRFRVIGTDESPDSHDAINADLDSLEEDLGLLESHLGKLEQIVSQLEAQTLKIQQRSRFKLINNPTANQALTDNKKTFRPLYTIDADIIKLHNISNLKVKPLINIPKLKVSRVSIFLG